MGTNYFLHPAAPVCGDCKRPFEDQRPERIHIGKSSMGWAWLWRGYRHDHEGIEGSGELPTLDGTQVWFEFLAAQVNAGGEIRDEYNHIHTLADLIVRVISKRGGHRQSDFMCRHTGSEDISFGEFS